MNEPASTSRAADRKPIVTGFLLGRRVRSEIDSGHVEGRNRAMQPFQGELAGLLGTGTSLDRGLDLAVDEDLAVGGLAAEAGRQVHHCADGGIVEAPLETDPAQCGVTLRDANTEAQLVAEL